MDDHTGAVTVWPARAPLPGRYRFSAERRFRTQIGYGKAIFSKIEGRAGAERVQPVRRSAAPITDGTRRDAARASI
jgi:hypothetical protein